VVRAGCRGSRPIREATWVTRRNCQNRRFDRATRQLSVLAIVSPHQNSPQRLVDLGRRLLLHVRGAVRVDIERDRDIGVPEALLDHLGMNTLAQQHGRVRVPQIVEAAGEAGLLEDPAAGTREVGRPPRLTVGAGEDEVVTLEAGPHAQAHLALRLAVLTQCLDGDLRQGDGAGPARRLRLLEGDAG